MNSNRKTKEILICVLVVISVPPATVNNAKADIIFRLAQNAGPVINTSLDEFVPCPEPLFLWFGRSSSPEVASEQWGVSRATEGAPWENPVNFGTWEESDWNLINRAIPTFTTADGLELYLYFGISRPDGYGGYDIWVKRREKIDDDWGPAINLGPTVNSEFDELCPAVSPDGLELYFSGWGRDTARPDGQGRADLWVTRRKTRDDNWGVPINLGPTVNTASFDARPILVSNGLLLFFESDRPGGFGSTDLYMMKRTNVSDPWTEPVNLGPIINSPNTDGQGFLSPDGSTLYLHSNRPEGYGGYDIWQVSVEPIVDFSGDGIIDILDLWVMIENWNTDESLCDIGPTPFGDGIVNIEDLKVFMEYWEKENMPEVTEATE